MTSPGWIEASDRDGVTIRFKRGVPRRRRWSMGTIGIALLLLTVLTTLAYWVLRGIHIHFDATERKAISFGVALVAYLIVRLVDYVRARAQGSRPVDEADPLPNAPTAPYRSSAASLTRPWERSPSG